MASEPFSRRRLCPICKMRTTHYVYPNRVVLPHCGCAAFVQGEPPYEYLPFGNYEPKYVASYYAFGPTKAELDALSRF